LAHFRASIRGMRGEASRLGSEASAIQASVNGWDLGIFVEGYYDKEKQTDTFVVHLTGGSNRGFTSVEIGRFTQADLEQRRKA